MKSSESESEEYRDERVSMRKTRLVQTPCRDRVFASTVANVANVAQTIRACCFYRFTFILDRSPLSRYF